MNLTAEQISQIADQKRASAKRILHQLFKIPQGIESQGLNSLVDDIISCAILEISALKTKALETYKDEITTP